MDGNDKLEKISSLANFVMLHAADHHMLLAGAVLVWCNYADIVKSRAQGRHHGTGQVIVAVTHVQGAPSGAADTELSCNAHLRPDGSTWATRCPVHRTWNQRLLVSVLQHLSASWPTQGQFYCLVSVACFCFLYIMDTDRLCPDQMGGLAWGVLGYIIQHYANSLCCKIYV